MLRQGSRRGRLRGWRSDLPPGVSIRRPGLSGGRHGLLRAPYLPTSDRGSGLEGGQGIAHLPREATPLPTGALCPGPGNPVAPGSANSSAGHSGTLSSARRNGGCRAYAIGTSVTCGRRRGNGSRAGPGVRWIDLNPHRCDDRAGLNASAALDRA